MVLSKPIFAVRDTSSSGVSTGSGESSRGSPLKRPTSPISAAAAMSIYKKVASSLAGLSGHFESLVGDRPTTERSECYITDARETLQFYESAWAMLQSLRAADLKGQENPVRLDFCFLSILTVFSSSPTSAVPSSKVANIYWITWPSSAMMSTRL